jgi:hypothetical protein
MLHDPTAGCSGRRFAPPLNRNVRRLAVNRDYGESFKSALQVLAILCRIPSSVPRASQPFAPGASARTLGRHPNIREENHEQSIRQHWT